MIFLKSQALDNTSADPFVVDGEVLAATDARVQSALRTSSEVLSKGIRSKVGQTEITSAGEVVALVIRTGEVDRRGRPSPVLATFPSSELDRISVSEFAGTLADSAARIGRTIDVEQLASELEEWRSSPKGLGAPLTRLLRWFRGILKKLFGRRGR